MLKYADVYSMQLLAWLATEPAESERRNKMRQTVVEKLNPFLQSRGVGIVSVAQRLWELVDAGVGLVDDLVDTVEEKAAYIADVILNILPPSLPPLTATAAADDGAARITRALTGTKLQMLSPQPGQKYKY
jgi:hypothetical protein